MKQIGETCYYAKECGTIISMHSGIAKELKPATDKKGYRRVGLTIDGKLCTKKVHRIIASLYISNPNNKPIVNHIDGNKANNNLSNLEWVTAKENTKHAIDNGLFVFPSPINKVIKRGELNGGSLLTEDAVRDIRENFKKRIRTRKYFAEKYNVTENCIKDVVVRKSWKHVI